MTKIQTDLFSLRDEKFADFNSKLMPDIVRENVIGVRTPVLRKYARELSEDVAGDFIKQLPHKYFEENQLHAFILSGVRDFDVCIKLVNEFLPYVDNWATCDQLLPRVFAKHTDELLKYIKQWIKSKHTYTVRFGIGQLMRFYLENNFDVSYAEMVAKIKSDEYYVNMMRAWYFATALAKNYDEVLPFVENKVLVIFTHNKTIQKAIESYRISDEQKRVLRKLK